MDIRKKAGTVYYGRPSLGMGKNGIILISTEFVSGINRIREMLSELQSLGELTSVSTLYKKFRSLRAEDLNSNITLVTRWNLLKSPEETFETLERLRASINWKHGDEITLLGIDGEVRLVPGENLPNPNLHGDSLVLRCAAEVYGEYFHPVLGQTLSELVVCSDPVHLAEFFSQGRSIFNGRKT